MKPVRTLLLWGPPGTGKTLLGKSFAKAIGMEYIYVDPAVLLGKYVGETERKIKECFVEAKRRPTVLFFDEIDSFARQRVSSEKSWERTMKNTLMQELQEFVDGQHNSVFIGATNLVSELDDAIKRRMSTTIFVDLPNAADRYLLLKHYLQPEHRDQTLTDRDLELIANDLKLYSGSDVANLVDDVKRAPIIEIQTTQHFRKNAHEMFEPCSPDAPNARSMSLSDIPEGKLAPRRGVTARDFETACKARKPTMTPEKHNNFLLEAQKTGGELTRTMEEVDKASPVPPRDPETLERDFIFLGTDFQVLQPSQQQLHDYQ